MATASNSMRPVRDSRTPRGRPTCSYIGIHHSRRNFSREKQGPHPLRPYTRRRTRHLCILLRGTLEAREFPFFEKAPWRAVRASTKHPACRPEGPTSSILRKCFGSHIGRIGRRKTV